MPAHLSGPDDFSGPKLIWYGEALSPSRIRLRELSSMPSSASSRSGGSLSVRLDGEFDHIVRSPKERGGVDDLAGPFGSNDRGLLLSLY
jgi:hypothetical protein